MPTRIRTTVTMIARTLSLATAMIALSAGAQVPQAEREVLIALYEATNGEEWVNNDGWLGNPGTECDWLGVYCLGVESGAPYVARLFLSDNGLAGNLPEDLVELGRLQTLQLAGNALTGSIPASWADMRLEDINLQHNKLSGDIAVLIAAMAKDTRVSLDLSHNQFGGAIPEALSLLNIESTDELGWPAKAELDLCWNDFDPPGATLLAYINPRHHGGIYADCHLTRKVVSPDISGSWFDPGRSGEGIVQHLLDNGRVLLFWFTFPIPERGDTDPLEQAWFMDVVSPQERSLWIQQLLKPFGKFGAGNDDFETQGFYLSIDPLTKTAQQISYSLPFVEDRTIGFLPIYGTMSNRQEFLALTKLAGTTCKNQQPHQWISGAWYDPQRAGEGFMVEVNEDGRGVVYWFTYEPGDSGPKPG